MWVEGITQALVVGLILAEQHILLDSTKESMLNWTMYPHGPMRPTPGWVEESFTNIEKGFDWRSYVVCDVGYPNVNNWLWTPFIERGQANRIHIEIKFSLRNCDLFPGTALQCKETFSLLFYEFDEWTQEQPPFEPDSRFKIIDRFTAEEGMFTNNNEVIINTETRSVEVTKKGMYFAFRDQGACLSLLAIKVYFKSCPEITKSIAFYPESPAGKTEGSFSTAPLEDSTFTDNPKVTVGLTSINVAWNPDQLPCVDRYNLTVCEVGGLCLSRVLEKGNLPEISYTLNDLRECTKYNISLLPLHKDANVKPFIKQEVTTTSNDKLKPQLEVIGDNQVNISWSPLHCAHSYLVYHYEGNQHIKHITHIETYDTSFKFPVTPCLSNSYAVTYIIDGMPGDQHVDLELPEKDKQLTIPINSFKSAVTESGTAFFSWDPVQCAEKYVISTMDSKDQDVVEVSTTNTSVEVEVSPCNKYTFSLKAVVGSREIKMGHREITTQLKGMTKYELKNLNVTYSPLGSVNVAWDAQDCVLGFVVRVLDQENVLIEYDLNNDTFKENKVSVKLFCNSSMLSPPAQSTNNVLQLGVSPIVSSEDEGSQILNESIIPLGNICGSTEQSGIVNSNSYVVPILIAVFVFMGVLVVVLVFGIKKRKNSLIYDTDNGKIIKPYSQLSQSTEEIDINEN